MVDGKVHEITIEHWSGRVVMLCSCGPIPISIRMVESSEAGDYTTDDIDGMSMVDAIAMADEHWTQVLD